MIENNEQIPIDIYKKVRKDIYAKVVKLIEQGLTDKEFQAFDLFMDDDEADEFFFRLLRKRAAERFPDNYENGYLIK